jgi:hypothetical protein
MIVFDFNIQPVYYLFYCIFANKAERCNIKINLYDFVKTLTYSIDGSNTCSFDVE